MLSVFVPVISVKIGDYGVDIICLCWIKDRSICIRSVKTRTDGSSKIDYVVQIGSRFLMFCTIFRFFSFFLSFLSHTSLLRS